MKISFESRENLADLKIAVLNILATANRIDSRTLFEKIVFVITDHTAHNLGFEAIVAYKLGSEYHPDHLFCNGHSSFMSNRKITKTWAEI